MQSTGALQPQAGFVSHGRLGDRAGAAAQATEALAAVLWAAWDLQATARVWTPTAAHVPAYSGVHADQGPAVQYDRLDAHGCLLQGRDGGAGRAKAEQVQSATMD